MLAKHIPPHSLAFVAFVMPFFAMILGLDFIERYAWLRGSIAFFEMLKIVSLIMVCSAAVWMAFENHLGRIAALGILISTGLALLSISTENKAFVLPLFFNILFANIILIGLLSVATTLLFQKTDTLELDNLAGLGRKFPYLTSGIVAAILALSGIPLLGNSTAIQSVFGVGKTDWNLLSFTLLTGTSVLIAANRILLKLFSYEQVEGFTPTETKVEIIFVSTAIAILLVINLFPNFLPISIFHLQEAMPNFLR